MNISKPPVLLLDGGVVSLSVARTLGEKGIKIFCFDISQNHGRFSKFCKKLPFYESNIETWVEWLTGEGLNWVKGAVILPCSDDIMEMVARFRSNLQDYYILPEANDLLLLAMLDKAKTYELAEKLDIPAPKTWKVDSINDIDRIRHNISFPCALKPRFSHEYRGRDFLRKLFIVNNSDELISTFKDLNKLGKTHNFRSDLIVTEIIPGFGENQFHSYYSYLDKNGNPLVEFTKRKLRQYPLDSGNGTYHLTNWNPDVAELGFKFMKGSKYVGLGAIEFKLDPRDGIYKLMECNPRMTNATELLRYCGFDIAYLVYNKLIGSDIPDYSNYKKGLTLIRPVRDFLAFREAHKKGILSWKSWLNSFVKKHSFEAFSWKDPLPWIMMGFYFTKRVFNFESKNKSS